MRPDQLIIQLIAQAVTRQLLKSPLFHRAAAKTYEQIKRFKSGDLDLKQWHRVLEQRRGPNSKGNFEHLIHDRYADAFALIL